MKLLPDLFTRTLTVLICSVLVSCQSENINKPKGVSLLPFEPIDTNFTTRTLILPGGKIKYQVLFHQGDPVIVPGTSRTAPARDRHDFLTYIPIDGSSKHGLLWSNHESCDNNNDLGDGGGATIMEVENTTGEWKLVGTPRSVDFSPVGGTAYNCLGALTPWGTVLTSEEVEPQTNAYMNISGRGIRDTSDYGGRPKYLNFGWVVEVDPQSGKALRKLWGMGRFMHEGIHCMEDKKTVYLMDDQDPCVFFKFVARTPGDLSAGQLYAFKENETGGSGSWITLPMDRASLENIRTVAYGLGATIFNRFEDIEETSDGNFLITETGSDNLLLDAAIKAGGKVSPHLSKYKLNEGVNTYSDPFGRILKYNPVTETISVFLEAGASTKAPQQVLSNPDNLAFDKKRNYLVIQEDVIGLSFGRVPAHTAGAFQMEIYFLDLSEPSPTVDKLIRFAMAPRGAETTGSCWTPDFNTMFFNIQHPDPGNPSGWNKACTVAVTGFD